MLSFKRTKPKNLPSQGARDNKDTQAVVLLSTQQKKTFTSWVFVSDFDGTFFTPDIRIGYEALYENRYITHMLQRKNIPLILNTVRSDLTLKFSLDLFSLGVNPDTIICGDGTIIYNKKTNKVWEKNLEWESKLSCVVITVDGKELLWNESKTRDLIENKVNEWGRKNNLVLKKEKGNKFLVKFGIKKVEEQTIEKYASSLQKEFSKGVMVNYSERLIPSVLGRVVGDLLITPDLAGKDKALEYVLIQYYQNTRQSLKVFCFGDGIRDLLSYLQMPSKDEYKLKQFLTHPTRYAKKIYKKLGSSTPLLKLKRGPAVMIMQLEHPLPKSKNDPIRKYITNPGKHIIDKFFPYELSANDITIIGLTKVLEGIDGLYQNTIPKGQALKSYLIGHIADSADGIRARLTIPSQRGQSTDYFSDRVREFYHLYSKGKKYLSENPAQSLITFEAGISCVLPSIARRQIEIIGTGVNPEKDKKLMWIPIKLIMSLLYGTLLRQPQKSFRVDKEILHFAEMKYNENLSKIKNFSIEAVSFAKLSSSQKNAVELWLLYVQVLQEENGLIKKILPKSLLKNYEKWFNSLATAKYMDGVDVKGMRKKFMIEDYGLHFKNFIKS